MPQANIAIITFSKWAENDYTCSLFERMPGRTRNEDALAYQRQTKTFFFEPGDGIDYAIYLRRPDKASEIIGRIAPYVIIHVSCHDDAATWKEAAQFYRDLPTKFQTSTRKILDIMMIATRDEDPLNFNVEHSHNIAKMQVRTLAMIAGKKADSTLADVALTTTMYSRVLRFLAPKACRVYRCEKCKKFMTFEKPLFQPCVFESIDEKTYACKTIIKGAPPAPYLAMECRSLAYHNITLKSEPDKPCLAPKSMLKRYRYVNRDRALEFARHEGMEDCFFMLDTDWYGNQKTNVTFGFPKDRRIYLNKPAIKEIFQTRIAPKCMERHKEIVRKIQERRRKFSEDKKKGKGNCIVS